MCTQMLIYLRFILKCANVQKNIFVWKCDKNGSTNTALMGKKDKIRSKSSYVPWEESFYVLLAFPFLLLCQTPKPKLWGSDLFRQVSNCVPNELSNFCSFQNCFNLVISPIINQLSKFFPIFRKSASSVCPYSQCKQIDNTQASWKVIWQVIRSC